MTKEQYLKNLSVPEGKIDVILDTDTYNEIDDQFALSYLIKNPQKLRPVGFCAAPFLNGNSVSPEDGMEKSYDEIIKLLTFSGREDLISLAYRGSKEYLPDENTPVDSPAARFMAEKADFYSPEKPLYIVAIGAITNVASAILMNPAMKENTVIVWLGGQSRQWPRTDEFNMVQDYAAARVVMGCGVPFVQLPCMGVVDIFRTGKWELTHFLSGKNKLADYLAENTIKAAEAYAGGSAWTRVIWDVTAVAWLLNDNERFMDSIVTPVLLPGYDRFYETAPQKHDMVYVTHINRDRLMTDLFEKLTD